MSRKLAERLPEGRVIYVGGEHVLLCSHGRHLVVYADQTTRDDGVCTCVGVDDLLRRLNTPWGIADRVTTLADGVLDVSTASHGGLLLDERVADSLPPEVRSVGFSWGGWLAFEEDCAYSAVFAARPSLWRRAQKLCGAQATEDSELARRVNEGSDDEAIRAYFLKIAQTWFPDEYRVPCTWCAKERCWRHA